MTVHLFLINNCFILFKAQFHFIYNMCNHRVHRVLPRRRLELTPAWDISPRFPFLLLCAWLTGRLLLFGVLFILLGTPPWTFSTTNFGRVVVKSWYAVFLWTVTPSLAEEWGASFMAQADVKRGNEVHSFPFPACPVFRNLVAVLFHNTSFSLPWIDLIFGDILVLKPQLPDGLTRPCWGKFKARIFSSSMSLLGMGRCLVTYPGLLLISAYPPCAPWGWELHH